MVGREKPSPNAFIVAIQKSNKFGTSSKSSSSFKLGDTIGAKAVSTYTKSYRYLINYTEKKKK